MGYCVMHIEKVTSGAGSLGAHIDRVPGKEYTYKNADPERLHLNERLENKYSHLNLSEGINQRIEEGYKGKKAVRKDAVIGLSIVLTGSHDEMTEIFKDHAKAEKWVNANLKFLENEFQLQNIIRFNLHLDEKTPHIHAVIVPLTPDGRLSAKEIMGNKLAMSERQTRYSENMQPFNLERGVVGSKAIHNSEGWYLGQQKKEQEAVLKAMPAFTLKDRINPDNFIQSVGERLKTTSKLIVDTKLEADRANSRNIALQNENKRVTRLMTEAFKDSQLMQKEMKQAKQDLAIILHQVNNIEIYPKFKERADELQKLFLEKKEREKQELILKNQRAEKYKSNPDFEQDLDKPKRRGLGM